MRIRLLAEARQDLEVGASFYESQEEGLGAYFLTNLEADIESLKFYGGIHERYRGYYRALSVRFPFAIYYTKSTELVDVYAVLDSRQAPPSLDQILGERSPGT